GRREVARELERRGPTRSPGPVSRSWGSTPCETGAFAMSEKPISPLRQRMTDDMTALSDQFFGRPPAVVASGHEQSVPIFQQLAGGYPSGRDDVREIPAVATQRRGSLGRAGNRHQP